MIYKCGKRKLDSEGRCPKCGKRWSCGVYWYKFMWLGKQVRESTKQGNDKVARQMESAHRTSLAKGEVGLRDKKPTMTLSHSSTTALSLGRRPRLKRHRRRLGSIGIGLGCEESRPTNHWPSPSSTRSTARRWPPLRRIGKKQNCR